MTLRMNKDQKDATLIVSEVTETSKHLGLICFGLGRSMTYMMIKPKQAAALLAKAAEEIEEISERLLKTAERIVEWDEKRIVTKVQKPLVDANLKPIA